MAAVSGRVPWVVMYAAVHAVVMATVIVQIYALFRLPRGVADYVCFLLAPIEGTGWLIMAATRFSEGLTVAGTIFTLYAVITFRNWWENDETKRRRKRLWRSLKRRIEQSGTGRIRVVET